MILHQITKPLTAYDRALLSSRINQSDIILLQSDATYDYATFAKLFSQVKVLDVDATARNIPTPTDAKISDPQWVELTLNCTTSITW